ncbi:MAG: succinyldiaminopimelate transaminase [Planctomycetes bacterium]|nr:succinyldiaminopimelate transaminase [Planctomycetota bacterium]
MNEALRRLATYPMVRLDQLKDEAVAAGRTVYDFGTGDPREPTPAPIREACRAGLAEISQYPKVTGLPAMRAAAADYLAHCHGVVVDPDTELLPTQGSKEAIFHLPMVLVDHPSSRQLVVYGEPAYPVFEIGALFAQATPHPVRLDPTNHYLLDPDVLGAAVLDRTAVVFLNYPHNPTGQLMPVELMQRWVAAQRRHGFVLVSDECYVDLYFDEKPHSMLEFGKEGVLAVHSLSKRSGMTGYRSGFVAGDAKWIAHYRRFRAGMGVAPTDMVQAAATVAWSDTAHVAERRALFGAKRAVFLELFAQRGMRAYPGSATLFLWVEVPEGFTDQGYCELLLRHGILCSPGSFFGPGQEGFFRLALVPSLDHCRAAAALWPAV